MNEQDGAPLDPALRLHPDQQELTGAQEVEAERFAEAYIQAQLSTEPVDEQEAEAFLRQAYEEGGLTAPRHIHWLDGPLELVAVLAHDSNLVSIEDRFEDLVPYGIWDDRLRDYIEISRLQGDVAQSIDYRIRSVQGQARDSLPGSYGPTRGASVLSGVESSVARGIQNRVLTNVGERIWQDFGRNLRDSVSDSMRDRTGRQEGYSFWHSICAYDEAEELALLLFFATYF